MSKLNGTVLGKAVRVLLAVALFAVVAHVASAADGTWTNTAGGTWGTAGNWQGSVLPDNGHANLTLSGVDYEVGYASAGPAFTDLQVINTAGNTTTLRISAPDFQGNLSGDRTINLGRGAKAILEAGGVWNLEGANTSSGSYLMSIANGGELLVDGGSFVCTNLSVTHSSRLFVNIGQGSAGVMTLDGGSVTMKNWLTYYPQINVGSGAGGHGTLNVKAGTLYMRNSLYSFSVANAPGTTGIVNQTGGTVDLTGVRISVGYNLGRGEMNLSGASAWTNERLTFGNSKGYGRMNMNGGSANTGALTMGDAGGTGVCYQTAGIWRSVGLTLARNQASAPAPVRGTMILDGGLHATTADGINIGWTLVNSVFDAYGLLIVSNGAISATSIYAPGQQTWYPHQGILLGRGADSGPMARGELHIAGGIVTNQGQLIAGLYPTGTGTYWQAGGTYQHSASGADKRHVIIGYGGGSGNATVSGGQFLITHAAANLYIGGVGTNVYSWVPSTPSTGTFTMRGGTVNVANEVLVSHSGSGTLTIGKAGSFTAKTLNLTNGVATLRFEFGDGGIGVCKATSQVLVGQNSRLEVDASDAGVGTFMLVECASRVGRFAVGNITVRAGEPSWIDQDSDDNIYLRIPRGSLISIR